MAVLKPIRFRPIYIPLLVIILGIVAFTTDIPFLELMELKTIDLRFQTRGPVAPGPEVVIAAIDEKSLAAEGKWMWPRDKFARMVDKLSDAGARVIAFDVGFLEPDEKSIARTIDRIEKRIADQRLEDRALETYLAQLKEQTDYDRILAEAIRNSKATVVLGFFFLVERSEAEHYGEAEIQRQRDLAKNATYKIILHESVDALHFPLRTAAAPVANIPDISEASDYAGYFNMFPDKDGVARSLPAVVKVGEDQDAEYYAPLAIRTLAAYLDAEPRLKIGTAGVSELMVGDHRIPTNSFGQIMINYRGKQETFPYISITDILNDAVDPAIFKDKIVFVGATATGIYDMRNTPVEEVFPGVEIHANIVDTILRDDYLKRPYWLSLVDVLAMCVLGLALGLILPRTNALTGGAVFLALFAGYIAFCQYMFSQKGYVMTLVHPLLVLLVIYISVTVYQYLVESRQKRFIKNTFSTYLAPSVVNHLIKHPDRVKLGGEKRVITAFFSDVQGFTSISEKLNPEALVELLNEFLTEMTEIILKYQGTVDKFEGDAIIAMFGAPHDLPNQAETACRACVEMQKRLQELRDRWREQGRPELRMRIGLCTGSAVVGNMGSQSRMDYTMMGDTVNTAARLEGVNKVYGTYIMISQSTHDEAVAKGSLVTRRLDAINVVGKKDAVWVYELIGYPGEVDEKTLEKLKFYEAGLDAYQNRKWDHAIGQFDSALRIDPQDGPSLSLRQRCEDYRIEPPSEDWNGSFTMKTK